MAQVVPLHKSNRRLNKLRFCCLKNSSIKEQLVLPTFPCHIAEYALIWLFYPKADAHMPAQEQPATEFQHISFSSAFTKTICQNNQNPFYTKSLINITLLILPSSLYWCCTSFLSFSRCSFLVLRLFSQRLFSWKTQSARMTLRILVLRLLHDARLS